MLAKDNIVKLADFGLSKKLLTRSAAAHSLVGTPAYRSPEQNNGRVYDEQLEEQYSTHRANTDIWLEFNFDIFCIIFAMKKVDIFI